VRTSNCANAVGKSGNFSASQTLSHHRPAIHTAGIYPNNWNQALQWEFMQHYPHLAQRQRQLKCPPVVNCMYHGRLFCYKKGWRYWAWWCMSIIPATWEAEVGRSWVQDQPGLHSETLYQKTKTKIWESWKIPTTNIFTVILYVQMK
jgi:hypothetical protein